MRKQLRGSLSQRCSLQGSGVAPLLRGRLLEMQHMPSSRDISLQLRSPIMAWLAPRRALTHTQLALVLVRGKLHRQLDHNPGPNGDQADGTNLGHHLRVVQPQGMCCD